MLTRSQSVVAENGHMRGDCRWRRGRNNRCWRRVATVLHPSGFRFATCYCTNADPTYCASLTQRPMYHSQHEISTIPPLERMRFRSMPRTYPCAPTDPTYGRPVHGRTRPEDRGPIRSAATNDTSASAMSTSHRKGRPKMNVICLSWRTRQTGRASTISKGRTCPIAIILTGAMDSAATLATLWRSIVRADQLPAGHLHD